MRMKNKKWVSTSLFLAITALFSVQTWATTVNLTADSTNSIALTAAAESATIGSGVTLSTTTAGAVLIVSQADNTTITNSGTITSAAPNAFGIIHATTTATQVEISNSGTITDSSGVATGIRIDAATFNGITNSGTISVSHGNAIILMADSTSVNGITNTGTIAGDVLVSSATTNALVVSNTGTVFGSITAGNAHITNSGTVTGSISVGVSAATIFQTGGLVGGISGGANNETVSITGGQVGSSGHTSNLFNEGNIELGAGNDGLQLEGGTVFGDIMGGAGVNHVTVSLGATGTFTQSGALNGFATFDLQSGTYTLLGGTPAANAFAVTTVKVQNGATFIQSNTVTATTVIATGTWKVAGSSTTNLTHNITGAFTLGTDGQVIIDMNPTGTTWTIGGNVDFGTGHTGSSNITINSLGFIHNGAAYQIAAGGQAGAGWTTATVADTALLSWAEGITGNTLLLTATRNSLSSIVTDPNAVAVGNVIENLATTNADIAAISATIQNLSTAGELESALQQLTPIIDGSSVGGAVSAVGGAGNAVSNQLARYRGGEVDDHRGFTAGSPFRNISTWGQIFAGANDQDEYESQDGYDSTTLGFAFGGDSIWWNYLRMGLAFSYANTDVDSDSVSDTQTDIDSYGGTVYATYDKGRGRWYYEGITSVHWSRYDYVRKLPTFGRVAKAQFDGTTYFFKLGAGYRYMWDRVAGRLQKVRSSNRKAGRLELTPRFNMKFTHVVQEDYSESEAGAVGLNVQESSVSQLQAEGGVRVGYGMVEARLDFWYNILNEEQDITSQFQAGGSAFEVKGEDPQAFGARLGFGLSHNINRRLELVLDYNFDWKEDFTGHQGVFQARYSF